MGTFFNEKKRIRDIVEKGLDKTLLSITTVTDDILKEIAYIYAYYLPNIKPEYYYTELIKYNRIGKLADSIGSTYGQYSDYNRNAILQKARNTFYDAYYRNSYLNTFFVAEDIKFTALNKKLVDYSLTGSSDLWKELKNVKNLQLYTPKSGSLSALLKEDKRKEILKVKKAVNQVFLGRMDYKDAKKYLEGTLSNKYAEMVLQTEVGRLSNLAHYTSSVDSGLDPGKLWISSLDSKTRDVHRGLDGQIVGIDEYFSYGGYKTLFPMQFADAGQNINCRCDYGDVFDDVELNERRGKNPVTGEYEVFSYKNYADWLKMHGVSY